MPDSEIAKIMSVINGEGVLIGKTNRSFDGNLNNVITFAPALMADKDILDKIVGAVRKGIENYCK